ncbi:MAG: hypothetical protein LUQ65_03015 [Candidatus Helarchaeota archaeon]|nr:hypothetical protein [Candidatus Helarchaeota archaeon]
MHFVKPKIKMKNNKTIVIAALILVLLLVSPILVQSEDKKKALPNTPRGLAQLFCKLDFEGVRLSTDNYQKSVMPQFLVEAEQESPGWDTVVLISKYKIEKEIIKGKQATVTVSYQVVGIMSNELTVSNHKEPYTFRLKKQQNKWVLLEPYDLPQHISIDTAIKHLAWLLKVQGSVEPSTPENVRKLKQLKAGLNK